MRFGVMTLIDNVPDAVSGRLLPPHQRLREVVELAVLAEELGYDAVGVGERHGPPFLASSPATVLGAIAARTHRIRLFTTVTVLSTLDPVRVAEEYATVDQLSGGRLELMTGKGNAPEPWHLFGRDPADQYALQEENYELLRRLWSEEKVTWSGRFRPPLENATTLPRPYQQPPTIWHGSATSERSADLAALWGDPLFTANVIQPVANYARLIDHYRERWAEYGHDPSAALVGAGGTLYVAPDDRIARREFAPYYEAAVAARDVPGNNTPFRSLADAADHGPALVGSPDRVIEKVLQQHAAYGHAVQFFGVESAGLPFARKAEVLRLAAEQVLPALRKEAPDPLPWDRP
ncbi:LLM class flavin-dependent oxidoreductase [Streptomyces ochraceiscleroticus]|uniref:LLM class flavin-dependent oxidoreductase n=1 Tax=Streptomyces ochraceiscleroticus TaxID=47761 RepID=A0ABW1MQ06_9ACTN|nr:LLM class flavin-dependent oxidoreductase [Streptomyces ochraceiscleroticus]